MSAENSSIGQYRKTTEYDEQDREFEVFTFVDIHEYTPTREMKIKHYLEVKLNMNLELVSSSYRMNRYSYSFMKKESS